MRLPLSDFEYDRVLEGARVPLAVDHPLIRRAEFTDGMLLVEDWEWRAAEIGAPSEQGSYTELTINPSALALDLEVRVCRKLVDQRIGEAMEFRGRTFVLAVGNPMEQCGVYVVAVTQGMDENEPAARLYELDPALYGRLVASDENLNMIRAALVRRLYPPKS